MAELKPYNPSLRDRLAAMLMGDAKATPVRRKFVEGALGSTGLGNTGVGLADFSPVGPALSFSDEVHKGDPQGAAMAIMPLPAASRAKALSGALSQAQRHIPGKPDTVNIPGTGEVQAAPIKELEESAEAYMRSVGRPGAHRIEEYPEFDVEQAKRIAQAFEDMKHDPTNPEVKRAYEAMIEETLAQYNSIKGTGLDIQFMKPGMKDPYAASPAMGYADIIENGHLWTFPTDLGHGTLNEVDNNPLLKRVGKVGDLENATANDAFRVVHDLYGHFAGGNPFFRHKGEERAWINHSGMYSDEARPAMTTETRGQNSWLNFGPYAEANKTANAAETTYADQKVGLLPKWAQEIIRKSGVASIAALPVSMQLAIALSQEPAE